jgi:hypothetical protein
MTPAALTRTEQRWRERWISHQPAPEPAIGRVWHRLPRMAQRTIVAMSLLVGAGVSRAGRQASNRQYVANDRVERAGGIDSLDPKFPVLGVQPCALQWRFSADGLDGSWKVSCDTMTRLAGLAGVRPTPA